MKKRNLIPYWKHEAKLLHSRDISPFVSLQHEMNHMFENFDRSWYPIRSAFLPAVEMHREDDQLIVSAELPGVPAEEVELMLEDNRLLIKGEKKSEKEEDKNGYHYAERQYGSFSRSVVLPEDVDLDSAEADFKDGILTIHFTQLAEAERTMRKIPLKA